MIFSAQYQQQPVPAQGNMIHADWLKIYETVDRSIGGQVVQSWDTASKEGLLNDWSVCLTAWVSRNDVYVMDVWRRKVAFPDLKKGAISNATLHNAHVLLIEDQDSGTQLIQTLWNEQPRGVPSPIRRKPEADKKTRLAGVSAMIEAGRLYLPKEAHWLAEFKRELLAFPSARHDDQVDALSQLLIWVGIQQRLAPIGISGPIIYTDEGWSDDDYGFSDPLY